MDRLRRAYFQIVPGLEPFFVIAHAPEAVGRSPLAYGSRQRFANLAGSLTTTSAVVAALNSMLAGSLASDLGALCRASLAMVIAIGVATSIASAAFHVWFAARFRREHRVPDERRAQYPSQTAER